MIDLEMLRANRTFRVVFPLVILLVFVWLSRQSVIGGLRPQRVSLAELETATKGQPFLTLLGHDGRRYRFQTQDSRTFLVDRQEIDPGLDALGCTVREEIGLFVTIKDGKIAAPDPRVMADWAEQHGLDGPLPEELIAPPRQRRALPVVRHTKQIEPTLLVLTSDGDWTDEDLQRLEAVLNDWLEAGRPEREKDPSLPNDQRPRLWYDEANSGRDLKTIVVRARHFQDAWCESLAQRLGAEYPFLWQMDVGEKPGPVFRARGPAVPRPNAGVND